MLPGSTSGPECHDIGSVPSSPDGDTKLPTDDLGIDDEYSEFDRTRPEPSRESQASDDIFTEGLKNAFPMDKIAKGGAAAKDFFSWGFGKVTEEARKVEKAVAESDFGKTIKTEVDKVKENEAVKNTMNKVQHGVTEVTGRMSQVIDPALENAKSKTAEVADHMKPHIEVAKEQTKTGFQALASTAVKTAIWFQSMGATGFDSDDEGDGAVNGARNGMSLSHGDPISPPMEATMKHPTPAPAAAPAMNGDLVAPAVPSAPAAAQSTAPSASATVASPVPVVSASVPPASAAPAASTSSVSAAAAAPKKSKLEDDIFADFDLLG